MEIMANELCQRGLIGGWTTTAPDCKGRCATIKPPNGRYSPLLTKLEGRECKIGVCQSPAPPKIPGDPSLQLTERVSVKRGEAFDHLTCATLSALSAFLPLGHKP